MLYLMLGAPGAGKTTQAELLAGVFGYDHISVGQLLRQQAAPGIQAQIAAGGLVDPADANQLVDRAIASHLAESGPGHLVIDGFPRSAERADWLLGAWRPQIASAWVLDLDPAVAGRRLGGRARTDDRVAAIDRRWQVYQQDTPQALDRLRAAGVPVLIIEAARSPTAIHREIRQTLAGN